MVKKAHHGKLRSSDTRVELSEYVYVTFPETVASSTSDDTSIEAEKYWELGTVIVCPSQITLSGTEAGFIPGKS